MAKGDLRIDWATHAAAKYACENWHYTKRLPSGTLTKIGVWENGQFIGVVIFSRGATPQIGSPYGLPQTEVCELTRIALTTHRAPVSRCVAVALRFLKTHAPGLRLVVSFADASQGHHGGVYQAGGWVYAAGAETHAYIVNGATTHPKSLHAKYGAGGQSIPWLRANVDPRAERIVSGFKHRYLMPLDEDMRQRVSPLSKPYPKRAKDQEPAHPAGLGGETPTRTLQDR